MTSSVYTAAARQPFAPVDRSRLHRLTSTKNHQNALPSTPTSLKRKAAVFEANDDSTHTAIKRKAAVFEADNNSTSIAIKRKAAVSEAKNNSTSIAIKRKAAVFEVDNNSTSIAIKRKDAVFKADNNSTSIAIKRKAAIFEADDNNSENIDPALSSCPKRVRGKDGLELAKDYSKPTTSNLVLTKALTSQDEVLTSDPVKSFISCPVISRSVLDPRSQASKFCPRSPASKLNTSTITSTILAPAGRFPTKKRRVKTLNHDRTASPFTHIDPPHFATGGSVASTPFFLDAALGGTIPVYQRRTRGAAKIPASLQEPTMNASWSFKIHEETAEETMTNLMEHSTSVLNISSDEESDARRRDPGKENVPPADDVSQTSSGSLAVLRAGQNRREVKPDAIKVDRNPLGDLAPKDFYPEGLSEEDIVYVSDDEEDELPPPEVEGGSKKRKAPATLGELMKGSSSKTGHAAPLESLGKSEEGFEIWESESAKSEAEGDD